MAELELKRVFISHTKNESAVALSLKKWMDERFRGTVETFVSESDITAGKQWLQVVEEAMTSANLVIVLCSPVSVRKTWVIFEAGAAWGQANVGLLPICHSGLLVSNLPSPLSSFQSLQLENADFAARFDSSLTEMLALDSQRSPEIAAFPHVKETLLRAREGANRFDVFVSAPMSSLKGSKYRKFRSSLDDALSALAEKSDLSRYYFAGDMFGDISDFDDKLVGTERDLRALGNSDRFLLILPEKLASSSLVEAGFALALGIPSVLFVTNRDHLPWALQEIGQLSESTKVGEYNKPSDIAHRISSHGPELWPTKWGRTYV